MDENSISSDVSSEAEALHLRRNAELAKRITSLIRRFHPEASTGLDVGAQTGDITSKLAEESGVKFVGIEPSLELSCMEFRGVKIVRAGAESLPFSDGAFDLATLISVYEHLNPLTRALCLSEICRILKPGGVLIGQIPNMYFPIEPHSRLLLQSYLPSQVGEKYFRRFAKVPWRHYGVSWHRVGPRRLKTDARKAGFRDLLVLRSNYSIAAIPRRFRRLYPLLQIFPLNFDFVFRKP
jgi:SAM-dependent methyltransferase